MNDVKKCYVCGKFLGHKRNESDCDHTNPAQTHGMTKTRIYGVWRAMIRRCYNTNDGAYHAYGGRGIIVSDSWRNFINFYNDMGERPSPNHSLDRKDTNGNYEKDNCVWSTHREQSNNTRRNIHVVIDNEKMTLANACRKLNLRYYTVAQRIHRGKTPEEALGLV